MGRAVFRLFKPPPRNSTRVARLVLAAIQQIGGRSGGVAAQELRNNLEALWYFGPGNPAFGRQAPAQRIRSIIALGPHNAVWATEGLGFAEGEAAWKRNPAAPELRVDPAEEALPAPGKAVRHLGVSLAIARLLLQTSASLGAVVERFLDLCVRNAPEGYAGVAVEGLGFAVRMVYPQRLLDADLELQETAGDLVSYFWHGVGRGIYFAFPRAWYSRGPGSAALETAMRDPPHEAGRRNALAGLSFAITLVNLGHPEILADFLRHHGSELHDPTAFSSGMAEAILMRHAWANCDADLAAFRGYQPDPGLGALWTRLIQNPCEQALQYPDLNSGQFIAALKQVREGVSL